MTASLATRVRFRLALWWHARLLPLRVRGRPLDAVIALAHSRGSGGYAALDVPYIVKRVRRTVRRPWLMRDRRCLREGLLAFRFLSAAGHSPELHFGVDRDSIAGPRLKAHCWVVLRGETVLSAAGPAMIPILVHRASDRTSSAPAVLSTASFG